jgi:hypothetical protein
MIRPPGVVMRPGAYKDRSDRKKLIAMPFRLRHATHRDAEAIAELFFASYSLLTLLPSPDRRLRRFAARG